MKKRITAMIITVVMIMSLASISAMAASASTDAGKYGTLRGYNYGYDAETTIDKNDGTGRLVMTVELQNNNTGSTYESYTVYSGYGAVGLYIVTGASNYPYPCAVWVAHEVRGTNAYVCRTVTVY